jgi:hypothetical protein
MIINGVRRCRGSQLAGYLVRKDVNESVFIRDLACYPAADLTEKSLKDAIRLMEVQGRAHGQKRTLFHASMALQRDERLDETQRDKAISILSRNLLLTGHQYVCVEHNKAGKQHFHVVFNIISPDTGKLARLAWSGLFQKKAAQEIEASLGLKPIISKGRSIKHWEFERGRLTGINPGVMRTVVTAIYRASATGAAFARSLLEAGYALTRGRYEQLVLIDRTGDVHGLLKRITGVRLRDLHARFPDLKTLNLAPLTELQTYLKREKAGASRHVRETLSLPHLSRLSAVTLMALFEARQPSRAGAAARREKPAPDMLKI